MKQITDKMIVECETEEQAKKLIKAAYEQGFRWAGDDDGTSSDDTFWDYYGDQTCYVFRGDRITYSRKKDILELWNMLYTNHMIVRFNALDSL